MYKGSLGLYIELEHLTKLSSALIILCSFTCYVEFGIKLYLFSTTTTILSVWGQLNFYAWVKLRHVNSLELT